MEGVPKKQMEPKRIMKVSNFKDDASTPFRVMSIVYLFCNDVRCIRYIKVRREARDERG